MYRIFVSVYFMLFICDVTSNLITCPIALPEYIYSGKCGKYIYTLFFSPYLVGCSVQTSKNLTNLVFFGFSGLKHTQTNAVTLKTVFVLQMRQNG